MGEGFKISPQERISTEVKERVKGIYFQQYSAKADNILVVGPVPGKKYSEIVFPILAPNPENEKGVEYGKYSVYFGGIVDEDKFTQMDLKVITMFILLPYLVRSKKFLQ